MKWISVNERLPDAGQHVLTYCPNYSPMPIKVNYLYDGTDPKYLWTYDCDRLITHWMPLPDSPEDQQRKQNEQDYLNALNNK